MKTKLLWTLGILGAIITPMILTVVYGLFNLGWFGFYHPKKENIRRNVFENTQSYVHGKSQDLAKYYEEYQKSDNNGKEAIRSLILMNFSDFDANKLRSYQLQQFLTDMRGY